MKNSDTHLVTIDSANYIICKNTSPKPIGFKLVNKSKITLIIHLEICDKTVANIILRSGNTYLMNNHNMTDKTEFNIVRTEQKEDFVKQSPQSPQSQPRQNNNTYKFTVFTTQYNSLPNIDPIIKQFITSQSNSYKNDHYNIDKTSVDYTFIEELSSDLTSRDIKCLNVCKQIMSDTKALQLDVNKQKELTKQIDLRKSRFSHIRKFVGTNGTCCDPKEEWHGCLEYGECDEEEEEESEGGGMGMFGNDSDSDGASSYTPSIRKKSFKTKTVKGHVVKERLNSVSLEYNTRDKLTISFDIIFNNDAMIFSNWKDHSIKQKLKVYLELCGLTNTPKKYPSEECCICLDEIPQVKFSCGHICCCYECSNALETQICPLCRAYISVKFISSPDIINSNNKAINNDSSTPKFNPTKWNALTKSLKQKHKAIKRKHTNTITHLELELTELKARYNKFNENPHFITLMKYYYSKHRNDELKINVS